MSKFKVGDVVKRKDGGNFSNGTPVATVGKWVFSYESKGRVALVETGTHIGEDSLKLADDVDGPVRVTTIIKKEIIPGTYGDVKIWPSGTICIPGMSGTDKKRLAEAIEILQIIHDAME